MSLQIATFLTAFLLIIPSLFLLLKPRQSIEMGLWAIRAKSMAVLLFGGAAVWFLWVISRLGASDFGDYKNWFYIGVSCLALGGFVYLKDFLPVRGLAILGLLFSRLVLDAAYMQPFATRVFLVSLTYGIIVLSLYLGVSPYRARDFFNWLSLNNIKTKLVSLSLLGYGVLLGVLAFSY